MNKKLIIIVSILLIFILGIGGFFIFKNSILPSTEINSQNLQKDNLVLSPDERQQFGIKSEEEVKILTQEEKNAYNIISENRVHFMTEEEKISYNITTDKPVPIEMIGEKDSIDFLPRIYLPAEEMVPTPVITEKTDSDGDGLTDFDELKKFSSDPQKTDTDGDGFSDGDEVSKGYNPAGEGKLK